MCRPWITISPLLYNDESVNKLLFCAEKGIPVIYLPSPNTGGAPEMVLLSAAMTDHIMEGIEVSDDTLMLDEVGPGGHFLNTEQTLKRFRDFWFPGLLHRARGIGSEAIRL